MQAERWLLPAGIEEILPPQARAMEILRRDLLDLYESWGYRDSALLASELRFDTESAGSVRLGARVELLSKAVTGGLVSWTQEDEASLRDEVDMLPREAEEETRTLLVGQLAVVDRRAAE